MKRIVSTLLALFAVTALCQAQNPNGTRVVKDASGQVKYTITKNGDQEVVKDSRGHVVGSTKETRDRKYYYHSNGSSAGTEYKQKRDTTARR